MLGIRVFAFVCVSAYMCVHRVCVLCACAKNAMSISPCASQLALSPGFPCRIDSGNLGRFAHVHDVE